MRKCWAAAAALPLLLMVPTSYGQHGQVIAGSTQPPRPAGQDSGAVDVQRPDLSAPTKASQPQASAGPHAEQRVPESHFAVSDAVRQAVLFTRYVLDVQLEAASATMRNRAVVTVKNDSAAPLQAIPVQISSTLGWDAVAEAGQALEYTHHMLSTDADHSGAMDEALVQLRTPLMPGAERTLTLFYSGTIAPSAQRLERIGTPADLALHTDWDGIRDEFTGLRGFGNVLWYPVCQRPVALGEGDRVFAEIALAKQRQRGTLVAMQVTEETAGAPPNIAFLNGVPVKVNVAPHADEPDLPSIASASLPPTPLGYAVPSLFLAHRTLQAGEGLKLYAKEANVPATEAYTTAASILTTQMTTWLGAQKRDLTILDLPADTDRPFEEGALLVTGMVNVDPKQLLTPLSHVLAHAYFRSPRPWLDEGVAQFMGMLWTEHQQGRELAITQMDNQRSALTLAETGDPDHDSGEPLADARDPIFYRSKAVYVLAMLRGIVGDKPLAAALTQYDPAQDHADGYFEQLLERASGQPLKWFFRDWVDRDRGLPELTIEGITPSRGSVQGSYIVAVTVANAGHAVADVPVTVFSAEGALTERMRIEGQGRATKRFLLQGEPEQVQVNDGTVPEVSASVHRKDIRYAAP